MPLHGSLGVTGFDNLTFLVEGQSAAVVEDAGDGLHSQRNGLDSGYTFDLGTDIRAGEPSPVRWLAEGRDASATLDAATGAGNNEGDNEITGALVANGDPGPHGISARRIQRDRRVFWRGFYTEQHGDNVTYEVLVGSRGEHNDD